MSAAAAAETAELLRLNECTAHDRLRIHIQRLHSCSVAQKYSFPGGRAHCSFPAEIDRSAWCYQQVRKDALHFSGRTPALGASRSPYVSARSDQRQTT